MPRRRFSLGVQSSLSRGGCSEMPLEHRRPPPLVSILSESRRVFGGGAETSLVGHVAQFQSSLSRGGCSEAIVDFTEAASLGFNPL